MNVVFYQFEKEGLDLPEDRRWVMAVGIDEDGTVYAPGACHPSGEMGAFVCASFDGTPCALYADHAYFPTEWMRNEIKIDLPGMSDKLRVEMERMLVFLTNMEERTRKAKAEDEGSGDL